MIRRRNHFHACEFRLAVDQFMDVPLIRLSGDMSFGQNMSDLDDTVRHLASHGHARLVLDLTDVESADSTGIGALLNANASLVKRSRFSLATVDSVT